MSPGERSVYGVFVGAEAVDVHDVGEALLAGHDRGEGSCL
jgi:hypothetical protein